VPIMAFGATISGLLAAALSFISEPLARLVLLFGAKALELGNWLAEWFVRWPLAWERIFTPTTLELTIVYALLIIWLLAPLAVIADPDPKVSQANETVAGARFGWRTWSAAALAIMFTIDATVWTYDRFLNPDLRVTFLSVGEGDGAVVRFPGSRVMLIDAGGAYGGFDTGERIVAPYLWSQKIMHVDYIVLSHPDFDHFGGLDFIAMNFAPDAFWTNGAESLDLSFGRFMDDIARAKIPVVKVGRVAPIGEIGGVSIASLNGDVGAEATHNNSSMVLRFSLGRASILFTGDIESAGERAMLESRHDLHSTILKVPHHGSATSSTATFIAAVHPEAAVISDGYLNHFHFPALAVLSRYAEGGVKLLRTDVDGAVIIDATPARMTIQTRRTRWLLEPKP